MFSGIVSALGKVKNIDKNKIWTVDISIEKISIDGFLSKKNAIKLGSSILCSGICLTVKKIYKNVLTFDVSTETALKTNFLHWNKKTLVNLERSLRVGDEMGGHFVSGHVDDISEVLNITNVDKSKKVQLSMNNKISKYIVSKGSVTLNGISLTINNVEKKYFEVNIIPFTWQNTNFCFLKKGSIVNIEVDLLARYLLNENNKNYLFKN